MRPHNWLILMQEDQLQFLSIEDSVFHKSKNGDIYIGKEKITNEMRDILQRDAEVFLNSRLFQVMNASIINEAYDIALKQSKNFDEVLNAKMLHHWNFFLVNMVIELAKIDK